MKQARPGYIIENDEGLAWSNTDGWIEGDNFDTFDEHERQILSLPMGGHWVVKGRKDDGKVG